MRQLNATIYHGCTEEPITNTEFKVNADPPGDGDDITYTIMSDNNGVITDYFNFPDGTVVSISLLNGDGYQQIMGGIIGQDWFCVFHLYIENLEDPYFTINDYDHYYYNETFGIIKEDICEGENEIFLLDDTPWWPTKYSIKIETDSARYGVTDHTVYRDSVVYSTIMDDTPCNQNLIPDSIDLTPIFAELPSGYYRIEYRTGNCCEWNQGYDQVRIKTTNYVQNPVTADFIWEFPSQSDPLDDTSPAQADTLPDGKVVGATHAGIDPTITTDFELLDSFTISIHEVDCNSGSIFNTLYSSSFTQEEYEAFLGDDDYFRFTAPDVLDLYLVEKYFNGDFDDCFQVCVNTSNACSVASDCDYFSIDDECGSCRLGLDQKNKQLGLAISNTGRLFLENTGNVDITVRDIAIFNASGSLIHMDRQRVLSLPPGNRSVVDYNNEISQSGIYFFRTITASGKAYTAKQFIIR